MPQDTYQVSGVKLKPVLSETKQWTCQNKKSECEWLFWAALDSACWGLAAETDLTQKTSGLANLGAMSGMLRLVRMMVCQGNVALLCENSPKTLDYFAKRNLKNAGNMAVTATGRWMGYLPATWGMNIGCLIQSISSFWSTAVHCWHFSSYGKVARDPTGLTEDYYQRVMYWLETIQRIKLDKMGVLVSDIVASCSRCLTGSIVTKFLSTLSRVGVKAKSEDLIILIAKEIHSCAQVELAKAKNASDTSEPIWSLYLERTRHKSSASFGYPASSTCDSSASLVSHKSVESFPRISHSTPRSKIPDFPSASTMSHSASTSGILHSASTSGSRMSYSPPTSSISSPSVGFHRSRDADNIDWLVELEVGHERPISAPYGPASAIFYELFTRRGLTAMGGQYNVDRFILEPAGWMALADKLSLV